MNTIALSVFPDALCKEISVVCKAVWDGKGQLVNQPDFLPSECICIQSREKEERLLLQYAP